MPLHCISDGTSIYAYKLDDLAWAEIKQRHKRERHLRFPCCTAIAVPKVSNRGTRFFAHYLKNENCTSAPESWLHLLAKQHIAIAAESAGWDAKTEHRLASGHIADVFVDREQQSFIFEVQLEQQDDVRTSERQGNYQAGGTNCIWLFKQPRFASNKLIPAFSLRYERDKFIVGIPPRTEKSTGRKWTNELDLAEFITKTLSGRLEWGTKIPGEAAVKLYGLIGTCPKCKRNDRLLASVHVLLQGSGLYSEPFWFWEAPPRILQLIKELNHSLRVGRFKERKTSSTGDHFLTNGCRHCGAEIPNWVVRECAQFKPPVEMHFGDSSLALDESLLSRFKGWDDLQRWRVS